MLKIVQAFIDCPVLIPVKLSGFPFPPSLMNQAAIFQMRRVNLLGLHMMLGLQLPNGLMALELFMARKWRYIIPLGNCPNL